MGAFTALKRRVVQFLASKWCFWAIVLLFGLHAIILSLTSGFQMAFDEAFHLGRIQFFSQHLTPFIASQPESTYHLGAIIHDPSFLFHYLLSFPYRLVAQFSDSLALQVISLRLVTVAISLVSLVVARKILLALGLKTIVAHIVLFVFAMTPIVPVLAAQINYDNLVVLMTLLVAYHTIRFAQVSPQPDISRLALVAGLAMLGCLVKFSFLPIFVAAVLCCGAILVRRMRAAKTPKVLLTDTKASYASLTVRQKWLLGSLLVISGGLFASFYGHALAVYKNPVPQCNQILSVEACKNYYAWNRNYVALQDTSDAPLMNAAAYTALWIKAMYYHLFAELIPTGGIVPVARPFYITVLLLTAGAVLCTALQIKKIFTTHRAFYVIGIFVAIYLGLLWARNYSEYMRMGEFLAVQGRYLVPVLVFIYATLALGVYYQLHHKPLFAYLRTPLVLVIAAAFIYYGGNVQYLTNVTPHHGWDKSAALRVPLR